MFSTLWTARASGNLIRNQLQSYTYTLHAVIDTLLKANVQTYLRSKVEVGVDALRAVLREHPRDDEARRVFPDLPRILLTGQAEENVLSDLRNERQVRAVFRKPWNEKPLLNAVRECLDENG